MNTVFIYHHLGLGDHIILNGLVRHYAEKYNMVNIFVKPTNISNVKKMYADNNKINFIALDDAGTKNYIKIFNKNKYIIVGHTTEYFNQINNPLYFDELFYNQHNIPFKYKWSKFYYKRDLNKEKEVFYDIYNLKDSDEFIFLHDSKDRQLIKSIPKDIKIIRPDNMDISIFDYLYLIEKSKEIHLMNSSIINLIDCIQLKHDNLFYHEYARPNINPVFKLNWKILK